MPNLLLSPQKNQSSKKSSHVKFREFGKIDALKKLVSDKRVLTCKICKSWQKCCFASSDLQKKEKIKNKDLH